MPIHDFVKWGIWHPASGDLLDITYGSRKGARAHVAIMNKTDERYRNHGDPPERLRSDYGWRLCKLVITVQQC